jgi:hypothetical protein
MLFREIFWRRDMVFTQLRHTSGKGLPVGIKWLSLMFWGVMLVGHIPALITASERLWLGDVSAGSIFKYLFILVSVIYFCLKLAGFRFWKIDPSWSRLIVYSLVILLLHTGVIVEMGLPLTASGSEVLLRLTPVILVLSLAAFLNLLEPPSGVRRIRLPALVPIKCHQRMGDGYPPILQHTERFSTQLTHRGPPAFFL